MNAIQKNWPILLVSAAISAVIVWASNNVDAVEDTIG